MSRTVRGAKGAGYDYWSRRPLSNYVCIGREGKKQTIRAERRIAKELIRTSGTSGGVESHLSG